MPLFSNSPEARVDDGSGFSPGYVLRPRIRMYLSHHESLGVLVGPNIKITLPPELWIDCDKVMAQWGRSDLKLFPVEVASRYHL
jgi:hypothetical protein